ncbi:MAG: hypothetical protein HY043_08155 [Verrucomicrobia bacterium]|nr:hypothetical protein [Verrucomicrobiota bacterium]
MSRQTSLVASFFMAAVVFSHTLYAQKIDIPNSSFESPVVSFVAIPIDAWQKLPKPDSFVETGGITWDQEVGVFKNTPTNSLDHIDNCDGNQAIWLFAVPQVGLFQDYDSKDAQTPTPTHAFDAKFELGKAYQLTVGLIGGGGNMAEGATLELSLYYRDAASNMVTVAATSITNTADIFTNRTHFINFDVKVPSVKAGDAWAGRHIGVQLKSTVTPELAGGYWDVDNFRLSAITRPALVLSYALQGFDLQITWPSETGFRYQVRTSNDLQIWTNLDAPLAGTGGELHKTVSLVNQSQAFFNVEATPTP